MRSPLVVSACCLLAASAAAQSMNLRYSDWSPLPSPTFGAATNQAGVWCAVATPPQTATTPLIDLAGQATGATAVLDGCDTHDCPWLGYGTDIQQLFVATVNGDCTFIQGTTRLIGLQPGAYVLTGYASPCYLNPSKTLKLELSDQSYTSTVPIDGAYLGSFDSMTLASFGFDLAAGVEVKLSSGWFAYLSAVQLGRIEPPAVYCTSKINSQGCAAKIAALGNAASLSGVAPFHVVATDVRNDVPGLLFYGFAEDVKPFLGGFHCVQPPTPRTFGQFSGGNGVPCAGTFDLDFNAWLATGPQPTVRAGARIYAQYWYRDVDDPFGSATSDAVSFHVVH